MTAYVTGLACLLAAGLPVPATAKELPKLVSAVPDDVFICVAGRHNAERKFLEDYWGEVIDAFKQTGITSDVMELLGSFLGDEQRAEVDRLKERASQLLDGVDWKALGGGEMVFAERLGEPVRTGQSISMFPEMVWLIQGSGESASKNYEGLVGLLQGILDEINNAAGKKVLTIETAPREDAKVSSVNLLGAVPDAPSYPISIALRRDVIVVALGNQILDEVVALLDGTGSKKSLAADPRFKQAFAKLPAPEDEMSFFDMQALLETIRALTDTVIKQMASEAKDAVTNAHLDEKADEVADKGVEAYQQKDYKAALEYTKKAHDAAPADSRIMYNLACFHALEGNKDDALAWLEKAVEGGFRAPKKIAEDSDLDSLRDDPRYLSTVAKAAKLAANSEESRAWAASAKRLADRIIDVPGMIDYVASVAYTDGYATHAEEITSLVPGADEKPFYPVFGKRKPLTNFERYLPKETVSFSVGGGIDLSELYTFLEDTARGLGQPGEEFLAKWAALQKQAGVDVRKEVLGLIHGEMITATIAQPSGNADLFMLRITDEAAVREKLTATMKALPESMKQLVQYNPMMAMLAIQTSPTTHEKLPGFYNITVGMSPQPLVCGVRDGYLIAGSSADAVALSLATAAGEHPNIRENRQLMAETVIPDGPFGSVSFAEKRNLGKELAQVLGGLSMMGGMATMAVPDEKARQVVTKILGMVAKLGPVVQKIDFYKSSSECVTFDGKTWRKRSVTHYRSPEERVTHVGSAD